jgi:hypothetical protein
MPKSCWVIPPKTEVLERAPNPPVILQQSSSNTPNLGSVTRNQEPGINPEKRAEGNAFGLLPPELRKIFSSDVSDSPKREEGEHPWRDEARALYPGTDVEQHILRIEKAAQKKNVRDLRAYGLACLKKHPPAKHGEKRRRPRQGAPKREELPPPIDPVKQADFQRRLAEWKEKGRPLGEFPE